MYPTEIQNFAVVWLTAIACLIFCHQIAARFPSGITRLISILPVLYLFTTLPLRLTSFHLGGPTIFYLVWLGNFKIILFSFNQGPLSSTPPLSLFHFISVALLPIKTKSTQTKLTSTSSPKIFKPINFLFKSGLLTILVFLYRYRDLIHPYLILLLYCFHIYLAAELIFAVSAAPVRAIFGLDLDPQFDDPYLATSLQDFWGRRWNLMVTSILRPAVYYPVCRVCTGVLGGRWAQQLAIFATFIVSGLMHELIYYYVTRVEPTWEVTWFFVLHGVCLGVEVVVKKKLLSAGYRLNRVVSGGLTLGFLVVTGGWLFFPQIVRNEVDLKTINEYSVFINFVKEKLF